MSAAVFSVISCETYKVDEPEMTAISKIDGKYVTFAYENGSTQPSTVFAILITNTTFNDSDKAWVTITDLNPAATSLNSTRFLDAVRFKVDVNLKEQTLTCSGITATEPRTAWNPYLEGAGSGQGGYYTAATKLGYKLHNFLQRENRYRRNDRHEQWQQDRHNRNRFLFQGLPGRYSQEVCCKGHEIHWLG